MLIKRITRIFVLILSITKTKCYQKEHYPYTVLNVGLNENTNLVGLVLFNGAYFGIFDNIVFNSSVDKGNI
jgi:hypothetical protein